MIKEGNVNLKVISQENKKLWPSLINVNWSQECIVLVDGSLSSLLQGLYSQQLLANMLTVISLSS